MSISAFNDKKQQLSEDEIDHMVGAALPVWTALIKYIRKKYLSEEDFKFLYGKKYGWALRFRIRKKLLTSLYPTADGFTVQINLSQKAIAQAEKMKLGKNVMEAIAKAKAYPEGRWLFIPVRSADEIGDIKQLLNLRIDTKRLQK